MKIFAKILWILNMFGLVIRVRLKRFIPNMAGKSLESPLIISLTSYGTRVNDLLPYTLFSLLEQTVRAFKIIVWLDFDHWNNENLPKSIKKMQRFGVDIKFCKDIRSYKKLIYTLKEYPNSLIVTTDDDQYYGKHIIEQLYKSYLKAPNHIHCILGHEPMFDKGKLLPYNKWKKNIKKSDSGLVFPLGGLGTLYPPFSLSKDVFDEDVFSRICPTADDIWFWAMGLKNNSQYELVGYRGGYLHIFPLDRFYLKGIKLSSQNVDNNLNDIQLTKVLDHYKLWEKIRRV